MAIVNTPYQAPNYGTPTYYASPQFATQPIQPYLGQNPNTNNSMIMSWVQGSSGAKAYPLGPNCRAFLFDSESDCFYLKTTDQNGMPQPLKCFDYSERTDFESSNQNNANYVTRDELEEIVSKLMSRNNRKDNYNGKQSVRANNAESRNERAIQ